MFKVVIPSEVLNTFWYICVYGLMAVPLTLSYRISKVLNFAHGVYITLGAYASVIISAGLEVSVSPVLAIVCSFSIGALVAVVTDILVFSPLVRKRSSEVTLMVASMGVWIFIKYAFYAVLDALQKSWRANLFYTTPDLDFPDLAGFKFLFIIVLTFISLSLLALFLTKTKIGLALRATADNPDLAQISGISKDRVMLVNWLISGGLAAVGGFAWSVFSYVSPEIGDAVILQVFACSVIGGLTSLPLTFVGSVVISSSENLFILFLNRYFGIELSFRPFLTFLVLLVTILVRPPAGAGGGLPYRFRLKPLRRR